MAHITGGGLPGNLVRSLPEGCRALLDPSRWEIQPIFTCLAELGNVPRADLFRTFNMGIGYTLLVRPEQRDLVMSRLADTGQLAWDIGEVVAGERGVDII